MSNVEREYLKSVDDTILQASGEDLKKLQELDLQTQLHVNSFYDAYATQHNKPKQQKVASTSHKKNKI